MSRLMVRARLLALVALVLVVALPTAAFQVSDEDLDEAERRLEELGAELDEVVGLWEETLRRDALLEAEADALAAALLDARLEVRQLEELALARAVEIYMDASVANVAAFFVSETVESAGAGVGYLEEVGKSDRAMLNELDARIAALRRLEADVAVAEADLAIVGPELEARANEVNLRLEEASAIYRDLRMRRAAEEEAARQAALEAAARAAAEEAARLATSTTTTTTTTTLPSTTSTTTLPTPTSTSAPTTTTTTLPSTTSTTTTTTEVAVSASQVCPVGGYSRFTDTWGAPRSGGRSHEGVDMLAARGTPVVAIESGTVRSMRNSSLGGFTVWLAGDSGDTFYYAHLDSHAPGLSQGQSVGVGAMLGYVGTSGNAPEHIPHLHFEYHPGGGSAVNPTPLVAGLCP